MRINQVQHEVCTLLGGALQASIHLKPQVQFRSRDVAVDDCKDTQASSIKFLSPSSYNAIYFAIVG